MVLPLPCSFKIYTFYTFLRSLISSSKLTSKKIKSETFASGLFYFIIQ